MTHYIDGFVFPLASDQLDSYREVAEKVAEIWKEHGALDYLEYIADDSVLEGTQSFPSMLDTNEDETIVFGWVVFESREARDLANGRVAADPRMVDLVGPLTGSSPPIFDAQRMVYGGFKSFIRSPTQSPE